MKKRVSHCCERSAGCIHGDYCGQGGAPGHDCGWATLLDRGEGQKGVSGGGGKLGSEIQPSPPLKEKSIILRNNLRSPERILGNKPRPAGRAPLMVGVCQPTDIYHITY